MSLYHGSHAIGAVYKGGDAISRIYKGPDLVWQAGASVALSNKWRINVSAVAGGTGNWTSVTEMQWALTPAGADQCTGGTPRASVNESGAGLTYADAAFDNNSTTTQWQSHTATRPQWLGYEFGAPITPTEVRLCCDAAPSDAPMDFTIDYYDSTTSSWVTVRTVTGAVMASGFNTFTFSTAPAFTSGPTWVTDSGFWAEGDTGTISFAGNYSSVEIEWQIVGGGTIGSADDQLSYEFTSAEVGDTIRGKVTLSIGTHAVVGYTTSQTIGTPAFTTDDRITDTSDQRITDTADVRIATTRTA